MATKGGGAPYIDPDIADGKLLETATEDGVKVVKGVDPQTIPTELPPTDASVTNAKVAADAAIAQSKLAAITSDDLPTIPYTKLSGTPTIPSVPTELPPTDGSVTDAKVASNANIAQSKLADITADDLPTIPYSKLSGTPSAPTLQSLVSGTPDDTNSFIKWNSTTSRYETAEPEGGGGTDLTATGAYLETPLVDVAEFNASDPFTGTIAFVYAGGVDLSDFDAFYWADKTSTSSSAGGPPDFVGSEFTDIRPSRYRDSAVLDTALSLEFSGVRGYRVELQGINNVVAPGPFSLTIGGKREAGKQVMAVSGSKQVWTPSPTLELEDITGVPAAGANKPLVADDASPHTASFKNVSPGSLDVPAVEKGAIIIRTSSGYEWSHQLSSAIRSVEFAGGRSLAQMHEQGIPSWITRWDQFTRIRTYTTGSSYERYDGFGTWPLGSVVSSSQRRIQARENASRSTNFFYTGTANISSFSTITGGYGTTYVVLSFYDNEEEIYISDAGLRGNGNTWVSGTLTTGRDFEDYRALVFIWGSYNSTTNDTSSQQFPLRSVEEHSASSVIPIGTTNVNYQFEMTSATAFRFRRPSSSYALKRIIGIL